MGCLCFAPLYFPSSSLAGNKEQAHTAMLKDPWCLGDGMLGRILEVLIFIEWINFKEAPGLPLLITFKDLKMILAQVKDGNFDCLSWMNLPDMTQVLL